jgi:hypothetical protein
MTIEIALSGLSYSMFCVLGSLFIIGVSLLIATAMIYGFIKVFGILLKAMKGGMDSLKDTAKALSQTVTTNN